MTAKNETNAALAQLKTNMREVESAAQGASGGGFMASLTSQLGGLGGAIAATGVAFGAMQLGTAAIDMAKTAAQVGEQEPCGERRRFEGATGQGFGP